MRVLKERPGSIERFTTSWRPSDGASRTTSVVQRRGTQPARVLPRAHRHWTPVQEESERAVRLESAHAQPSQRLAPHTARAVRACPDARRVRAPTERLVGRPAWAAHTRVMSQSQHRAAGHRQAVKVVRRCADAQFGRGGRRHTKVEEGKASPPLSAPRPMPLSVLAALSPHDTHPLCCTMESARSAAAACAPGRRRGVPFLPGRSGCVCAASESLGTPAEPLKHGCWSSGADALPSAGTTLNTLAGTVSRACASACASRMVGPRSRRSGGLAQACGSPLEVEGGHTTRRRGSRSSRKELLTGPQRAVPGWHAGPVL